MSPRRPTTVRLVLELLLVAVACPLTGKLALLVANVGSVCVLWPPAGIAVAALFLRGPRMAIAVAAGSVALELHGGASLPSALLYAAFSTGASAFIAWQLARRGFRPELEGRRDVALLLATTAAGMALAATAGIARKVLLGQVALPDAAAAWLAWWSGDTLGVLVVGAALLTGLAPTWRRRSLLEHALLLVSTLLVGYLVFAVTTAPIGFLAAAPLCWAGLRFTPREAMRTQLCLAALALYGTSLGRGPFLSVPGAALYYLTAYLATMSLCTMLLGALIAEWRRAQTARHAAEERRVAALVDGALGTFDYDFASQVLRWDEGHCALWGITPEEFDGRLATATSRVHPADVPRIRDAEAAARARREPFRYEFRLQLPGGVERWIEVRATHPVGADGAITGLTGVAQDVTARKTTELALAEAHERLRLALEHGRMAIWDVDIGDPARRAALLARFDEEDRPAAEAAAARSLAGEPFKAELRVRLADGSTRWRSIYGAPHRGPEGEVRLLGVSHDVTGRVLHEEMLQRNAAALAAVNRCQSELLSGADPRATFDGLLAAVLALSNSERGLIAEAVEGEGGELRAHAQAGMDIAEVAPRCAGVLAGEGSHIAPLPDASLIVPLRHGPRVVGVVALAGRRDGYAEAALRLLEPVLTSGGHLIASWRERQRRERAEASLREEQQRSAGIIAAALDGIVTVDERGAIVDANPAAEQIFSAAAAALRGTAIARLLPAASGDRGRVAAVTGQRQDGTAVPLEVAVAVVEVDGRRLLTYTLRDVSERRRAEETRERLERQLREAQKMEAIGTLAGGIAHDFNNILGAVLGNVDLMRHDIEESHPAHESLVEVRAASLRARDLVRQILAFSRRSESPRRAMTLGPVIEEAVRLIRASLPKAVRIDVAVDKACPPVVADASQLHQVMLNLGTNAYQALHRKDGHIEVSLEEATVSAALAGGHPDLRPGRWVRLAVRDNGSGMDAATRERIFEPFFTTKPPGEGTGLGLAVVHGIVKAHGGAVMVDSELGVGTTFAVYLPLAAGAVAAAAATDAAPSRGRGERVLFVDDEPALVAIGVRTLSRLGYEVIGAASGRAALDAVRAAPGDYAAVVTDLTMPGMTGLELGNELRKVRPDLPMILVSGYAGDAGPEHAAAIGFRDMLAKPAPVELLADALRRAIDAPRA